MSDAPAGLHSLQIGGGTVVIDATLRLALPAMKRGYADAQLDDTAGLSRSQFRHRAGFHFGVRARASHPAPVGTLGFGLWNDPFGFSLGLGGIARKLPATPQAMWFFYGSPPNDMGFGKPGVADGWKAATLRSPRLSSLFVAAAGALTLALGPFRKVQAALIRSAMRRLEAEEVRLACRLDEWHTYALDWTEEGATFRLDGEAVLRTSVVPDSPLGFVTWIDNQFAVVSPKDGLRFGVLPVPEPQYLELRDLTIEDSAADSLRPSSRGHRAGRRRIPGS
jgi:hypothetical protein